MVINDNTLIMNLDDSEMQYLDKTFNYQLKAEFKNNGKKDNNNCDTSAAADVDEEGNTCSWYTDSNRDECGKHDTNTFIAD